MTRDHATAIVDALEEFLDASAEWTAKPSTEAEETYDATRDRLIDVLRGEVAS